jgi:hypothetical protein
MGDEQLMSNKGTTGPPPRWRRWVFIAVWVGVLAFTFLNPFAHAAVPDALTYTAFVSDVTARGVQLRYPMRPLATTHACKSRRASPADPFTSGQDSLQHEPLHVSLHSLSPSRQTRGRTG